MFSLANDGVAGHGKLNFWLAKNHQAGGYINLIYFLIEKKGDEGFILDLGCAKKVVGVRLKNTHNRYHRDRGTKKFCLFGSMSTYGPWQTILEKNLEDPRQQNPPPVKRLLFEKACNLRYLKFQLVEFWGYGGGLQHLSVIT